MAVLQLASGNGHDCPMRVYWAMTSAEIEQLLAATPLEVSQRVGTAVTQGFIETVETTEQEELDLLAAFSAIDSHPDSLVVGVLEVEAEITDDQFGDVAFSGSFVLEDFDCLLLADVDSQELSWFGIQEADALQGALANMRKK